MSAIDRRYPLAGLWVLWITLHHNRLDLGGEARGEAGRGVGYALLTRISGKVRLPDERSMKRLAE